LSNYRQVLDGSLPVIASGSYDREINVSRHQSVIAEHSQKSLGLAETNGTGGSAVSW
jgi:hypothetical protein